MEIESSLPPNLIRAKLARPGLPAGQIKRSRLLERLDFGSERLTLVSAPAGYGKSTLIAQWIEAEAERPAAWLSLDRLDNDLERFTQYVVGALLQIVPSGLQKTKELSMAANLPQPQYLAESIVRELEELERQVVLVIDDYGFVQSPAVHELVVALVSNLPPTLHLIIVTRIDPPLPLSLWRTRGWIRELRASDLRFSQQETEAFLKAVDGPGLSDKGIEVIHLKTEGWIAGLRLATLSMAGLANPDQQAGAFAASDRLVSDYLMEEVLARQSAETREFLAITAVLHRFNAELCDDLLAGCELQKIGSSQELLDQVFRENLFLVMLGPVGRWYRYHHLFRELILERFDELSSAASRNEILERAGKWFVHKGWIDDGLQCFLEAGKLDAAADVLGRQLQAALVGDLSRRTLARWLDMFPPGAERGRLPLLMGLAYLRTFRADYDQVERLLEEIDTVLIDVSSNQGLDRYRSFQPDVDFLRTICSFWSGDFETAIEHGARVLGRNANQQSFATTMATTYYCGSLALSGKHTECKEFIEHGTTGPGFQNTSRQLPFLAAGAVIHVYRGEMASCQSVASRLITGTSFRIPKYFEALGYYLLGVAAYELNLLDEAEKHFLAVESRRFEAPTFTDHSAKVGLALIEVARGNLGFATRHADAACSLALESGSSMLFRVSEALGWIIALAANQLPGVPSKLPFNSDFMYVSIIQPCQIWAWAQAQSPSNEARQAALDVIDASLHSAEKHGVMRRAIQLSALRAFALDALGRRDESVEALEASLHRGADLGLVRSFLDLGKGIQPVLEVVAERMPGDKHVALLLDAFTNSGKIACVGSTAGPAEDVPLGDLTNREMDVLELLQRRLTNKEIAAKLQISAATVKSHTLGIYSKLAVRGRRQAVRKAIELRILVG